MKTILLAVLLLTQADQVREVTRLEEQLSDALVRLDVRAVENLWSDDLVFVGPNGKVSTKTERLAGMKAPINPADPIVSGTTNDEIKVRIYNDTAVVTLLSTWKGKTNAQEFTDRYMTTHVWAKQRGRWLLVSAHVTRLPK